jgi:hypothetical protein
MHALARCIHLCKATNKWDNTSALTNLRKQKQTNIKPSNQDSITQLQGKMSCLKGSTRNDMHNNVMIGIVLA